MKQDTENYQAFLLRLWCIEQDGTAVWYASLQRPDSDQKIYFSSIEALCLFLQSNMDGRQAKRNA